MFQSCTAEEVWVFTKELSENVGMGGDFIKGTDIGEMEGCKPVLVKVWVETTKEYGVY